MSMKFADSERSTIGIEWELQLIDRDSLDLRQCGDLVVDRARELNPDSELIHGEMLRNTVELVSGKQTNVAACAEDLQRGVDMLAPVIDPLRIDLASAGSHPFANPEFQRVSDSERYAKLVNRTQYWGRQMLLYGTHVHVGVEDYRKVLPILNYLLTQLGLMQALSASSPFWGGVDTRYCDNRAMVFQQLPTAGTPRQFTQWHQLEEYTAGLMKTGVIGSFNEVRWDIRPSPALGTIEVRVCDAASNLTEVRAAAALIHALVETASRRLDAGEELPTIPPWFLDENKWRAARYGMDATLIENAHGDEASVKDTLPVLLEQLAPAARDLNCLEDLEALYDIAASGVGYQRQRAVVERTGTLEAVVEHMCAEFESGKPVSAYDFEYDPRGMRFPDSGNRGW